MTVYKYPLQMSVNTDLYGQKSLRYFGEFWWPLAIENSSLTKISHLTTA